MYFLAGIESNQTGKLLTFEPNDVWREVAVHNLSQISNRFDSIAGTFEDNIADALPRGQGIDLAFIDAIHTKEFVLPQLEIVLSRSSDNAIIILDDINFSESMKECWKEVSMDIRFSCSAAPADYSAERCVGANPCMAGRKWLNSQSRICERQVSRRLHFSSLVPAGARD